MSIVTKQTKRLVLALAFLVSLGAFAGPSADAFFFKKFNIKQAFSQVHVKKKQIVKKKFHFLAKFFHKFFKIASPNQ